jgi:hypothetical protein
LKICNLVVLSACAVFFSLSFGTVGLAALGPFNQSENDVADLKIVVLEGEDSVNIIKKKTAVQPVVEVRDKNDNPVAGAAILAALPTSGPSAVFADGSQTMALVTDSAGRVAVSGMQPVGVGSFVISVTAHRAGHRGSTTIRQTNVLEAAAAAGVGAALAASQGAVIGVASSTGAISLNNSPVSGTANLSEGASLKTTSATSEVHLENGSTVGLGINSAAAIYSTTVLLHSGVARVDHLSPSFDVQASGYRIEGDGSGTFVAVRLEGEQLQVASIAGPFTVYSGAGVLLKTVPSGGSAAFDVQAGAAAAGASDSGAAGGNSKKGKAKPSGARIASSGAGAGAGSPLSSATALLIIGGLVAAGAGVGAYYGSQGGGTPQPISPL